MVLKETSRIGRLVMRLPRWLGFCETVRFGRDLTHFRFTFRKPKEVRRQLRLRKEERRLWWTRMQDGEPFTQRQLDAHMDQHRVLWPERY